MKSSDELKAKRNLQSLFVKGVQAKTWAEARTIYPAFTTDEAFKPYVGKYKLHFNAHVIKTI